MADTVIEDGGKTVIHDHDRCESGHGHLSRQMLQGYAADNAMALLREVSATARETLGALAEVRDTIREDGERTRSMVVAIERERASRELLAARTEILFLRGVARVQ